jgi:small basic protein (TIGR04137 family)
MSLDASLKAANALIRHRNVLKRDERLAKLKEEEKWQEGGPIFGLPKVGHRKMALAAKAPKEEGDAAAAGTPAAGTAAPAKGAAPAAAAPAKGAAPAAKGAAPAKAAAPAAKKK